jgi:YD repeat-containing protein
MNKTIAEQLNIKDFPFEIRDKQGNRVYYEDSDGVWERYEYDSEGNEIYHEDSTAFWAKYEYDSDGNEIYFENSEGVIIDNRPKDEIITLNGIKYKRIEQ